MIKVDHLHDRATLPAPEKEFSRLGSSITAQRCLEDKKVVPSASISDYNNVKSN